MTLSLHQLTYRDLLKQINLNFKPGHLYGILGPNGAGKSTLLKTITGIWMPTEGKISWQGDDLHTLPRVEISHIVTLVPQNPSLSFDITAEEMVGYGRYSHNEKHPKKEIIEWALQQVDGTAFRRAMMSELSGGERQRIYIARALATEAPILLLDEPTSFLDLRHQFEIWNLLRHLVDEGQTIITAVHDLSAAHRYCDQVAILDHGHCVASGGFDEVMTASLLKEVFGIQRVNFNDTQMFSSFSS